MAKEYRVHCDDIIVIAEDPSAAKIAAAHEFIAHSWAEESGRLVDETEED